MPLNELIKKIKSKTEGKVYKPLALPKNLSKRPQFYG